MVQIRPRAFPVERGKVHEFANAILDEHPYYHDEGAAHGAGLPAVTAPPTSSPAKTAGSTPTAG